MLVEDLMTRDVTTIHPDQSIADAARMMRRLDVGILPVAEHDRLVGMITDRDIALRGTGQEKPPDTPVREIMTPDVKYCFADQGVDEVAENMADIQVRRLPVLNREKRLVGILSLADIATSDEADEAGEALSGISRPNVTTQAPQFPIF